MDKISNSQYEKFRKFFILRMLTFCLRKGTYLKGSEVILNLEVIRLPNLELLGQNILYSWIFAPVFSYTYRKMNF